MLDALIDNILQAAIEATPVIVAGIAPLVLAAARKRLERFVPPERFPLLLLLIGPVLIGIAETLGVDTAGITPATEDLSLWQRLIMASMVGGMANALHQVRRQHQKAREAEDASNVVRFPTSKAE